MAHQSDLIAEDITAYLKAQEEKSMLRFITCGSVDLAGPPAGEPPQPTTWYHLPTVARNTSGIVGPDYVRQRVSALGDRNPATVRAPLPGLNQPDETRQATVVIGPSRPD